MDKEHSTPAGYGFLDRIVQIVADAVRSREHLVEEVLECIEHEPAEREQWKLRWKKSAIASTGRAARNMSTLKKVEIKLPRLCSDCRCASTAIRCQSPMRRSWTQFNRFPR